MCTSQSATGRPLVTLMGDCTGATRLEQRAQRQLHGGGVAAGVGHQARPLYLLPVQLCQAVYRLLLQLGRPVLPSIPASEHTCLLGIIP